MAMKMASSASVLVLRFACLSSIALLLAACPKKDGEGADAAAEAAAPAVTPATTDTAPVADAAATPLTTTTTTAAKVTPKPVTDGGATAADAGGTTPTGQDCCCEVAGQPMATVNQSECTTTRKGQCVKKEKCAGILPPDAGLAQTCCCNGDGKKEVIQMSTCAKERKGQCVKMTECKK
jgi:hypothetical protein